MVKFTKQGSVLIYALILITLSLIMAAVILRSATILSLNYQFINAKDKLSRFISDNGRVLFKLGRKLNSNGSGFVDNLRCPQTVTMSGSMNSGTVATNLYVDSTTVYCLGSYSSQPLKIYFNSGVTDLSLVEYQGSFVSLVDSGVGKRGSVSFSDSDNTLIDFSTYNHRLGDSLDDNVNSDNYSVSSTGVTSYPNAFQDDDVLHRKVKFGYVAPGTGFNSIFWNNSKTSKYIEDNTNNADGLNTLIGTSTGVLYVDVDKEHEMFLYKFDKKHFSEYKELKTLEKLVSGTMTAGVGYIQDDGGSLSLSGSLTVGKTGNEYLFDFANYDYALLVENLTTNVLSYNVRGFDSVSGSGLYIVPIDDSDTVLLRYFGNTIIIDENLNLIYEEKEIISSK